MNFRHITMILATAISFPIASQAQESTPAVTRAQIRAELIELEGTGYHPDNNDLYYPANIQKAETRIAFAGNSLAHPDSGVGGVASRTSASGSHGFISNRISTVYDHQ
jgi:hypothetical protein